MKATNTHKQAWRKGIAIFLLIVAYPAFAGTVTLDPQSGRFDLAPAVDYIEDPTGHMSIDDAAGPAYKKLYRAAPSRHGDISFGLSASTYWLRVDVGNGSPRRDWLLEVGYPALDQIEFYVRGPDGAFKVQRFSDRVPFSERVYPHRNAVFPLALSQGETQTLYLRVSSEGPLTVPLRVWDSNGFAAHDHASFATVLIYLGMHLALSLYNLLLFASIRERVYLIYAVAAAVLCVAVTAYSGLASQYLWPDSPEWGNLAPLASLALTCCFGIPFMRDFLKTWTTMPREDRYYKWLLAWQCAVVAGVFLLPYRIAVATLAFTAIAMFVFFISGGVTACKRHLPGARYFLLAWGVLGASTVLFALWAMGVVPSNALTANALQYGSAVEMLLLAFALADRINIMRREKDLAQQKMVEMFKATERELAAGIEARTVELELANKKLTARERELEALVRQDPLTGLANRIQLADRVDHALALRKRDKGMLAMLLIDLDQFKPVNDSYGHGVGDELLRAVGQRFKTLVRETDTVARLGGDEFVILLENVPDPVAVVSVTQKLVDAASEPFHINGLELKIGASVGAAFYPQDGTTLDRLLEKADSSMYEVKLSKSGRLLLDGSSRRRAKNLG